MFDLLFKIIFPLRIPIIINASHVETELAVGIKLGRKKAQKIYYN